MPGKRWLNPLTAVLILSGIFFAIFLTVSGVFYLTKGPSAGSKTGFFNSGYVGLVEINGVIMDSRKTLAKLERAEENDQVRAVVLRLNSPGGSVAPSQEIYEKVKGFSKPVVVSMGSLAASGAYYIASGANKIFANPGTLTGSIGVIMQFANLEKLYDWAKIHRYSIKAGRFKDAGAEYREMSPEEKALLQTTVDDVLTQFKKAVMVGRSLSEGQVAKVADGRIMTGQQAKAAHLVDELGTLQDAIAEAGKLGNIKGKPHVISYEKRRASLLEKILDDSSWNEEGPDSSSSVSLVNLLGILKGIYGANAPHLGESVGVTPGLYWLWGSGANSGG